MARFRKVVNIFLIQNVPEVVSAIFKFWKMIMFLVFITNFLLERLQDLADHIP